MSDAIDVVVSNAIKQASMDAARIAIHGCADILSGMADRMEADNLPNITPADLRAFASTWRKSADERFPPQTEAEKS